MMNVWSTGIAPSFTIGNSSNSCNPTIENIFNKENASLSPNSWGNLFNLEHSIISNHCRLLSLCRCESSSNILHLYNIRLVIFWKAQKLFSILTKSGHSIYSFLIYSFLSFDILFMSLGRDLTFVSSNTRVFIPIIFPNVPSLITPPLFVKWSLVSCFKLAKR